MEHQTPQEFHGRERQGTQAVATLGILVAEGHLAILQGDETVIGDGHTVGIAGQVLEDVLGLLEGLFRVTTHSLPRMSARNWCQGAGAARS
jgi:hypothetical protein